MKKRLVRAEDVEQFICRERGSFLLADDMILTPGAKDELRRRNAGIVKAACRPAEAPPRASAARTDGPDGGPASPDSLENLVFQVADMLHRECGVHDPETLKAMTLQALKTIKANI